MAMWLTIPSMGIFFQKQDQVLDFTARNYSYPTIHLDATRTYQSMEGFGFALTGGSAYLLNQLPASVRSALLQEIFSDQGDGIGVNYLRVSIGASDLSKTAYSYNDLPVNHTDPELSHFNLNAGDHDVIPVLRDIIAINPYLKIMGTPWSAPPWMKTKQSFIGGKLSQEYYQVYANYLVKYLQAMKDHGITIDALTIQNEPLNQHNEPSMVMTAHEQSDFIKHHLGPTLRDAGLATIELFCWDHNCDMPEYPLTIIADGAARDYLTGVAWHLYGGDPSALSTVHHACPQLKMAFTEQWVGRDGNFADDLAWHIKNVMIGTIKNWSQIVLEWNLAADPNCGPHTPQGASGCVGAFTIDPHHALITRNVSYYIIAHFAKFIRPQTLRIFSTEVQALPNVAFTTPNNDIVLIVLNENKDHGVFAIQYNAKTAITKLAGGAVGTYIWPAGS